MGCNSSKGAEASQSGNAENKPEGASEPAKEETQATDAPAESTEAPADGGGEAAAEAE